MVETVRLGLRRGNPDVLTCISNLSNDEVFTPPDFAARMLDQIAAAWAADHNGDSLWKDSEARFLDPFTKSGAFLREIVARLIGGLAEKFPDLQERVDHILVNQVFGIGITALTSLMSRRSVYCSKFANGEHSITRKFENTDGNIWFRPQAHTWAGDSCAYCGANKAELGDEARDSHAYALIHTMNAKQRVAEIFGNPMQFDVIVGNPPYQLSDGGGGGSATPIYHKFVKQAMALEPRYLSMVVPSRWFAGGRGLATFRGEMLSDGRIRSIVDFILDKDAFPKVNVNGGVNYFLWNRDNPGDCAITTIAPGGVAGETRSRPLNEFDIFVRRNEAVGILRKVRRRAESTFSHHVSPLKPFGLRSNFHGATIQSTMRPLKLYGSGAVSWVAKTDLLANAAWADRWKVLLPRATDGNENYPLPIWDQVGPIVSGPGEACTETYLVAFLAQDEGDAVEAAAYMRTRFFRFMVSLRKLTQDNKAENFSFVPDVPLNQHWTDEKLFARYKLSRKEVNFIESQIREAKSTIA